MFFEVMVGGLDIFPSEVVMYMFVSSPNGDVVSDGEKEGYTADPGDSTGVADSADLELAMRLARLALSASVNDLSMVSTPKRFWLSEI